MAKLEARVRELEYLVHNGENKENSNQNVAVTDLVPNKKSSVASAYKTGRSTVSESLTPEQFIKKSTTNPVEVHSLHESMNAGIKAPLKNAISNAPTTKLLPINKLKEIIFELYTQKERYDHKCQEAQLPQETMEQFLYTHLNQKYGLRTLIVEQASTIVTAIRTYLRDDHEITLFAKILKNECDEEFRFV